MLHNDTMNEENCTVFRSFLKSHAYDSCQVRLPSHNTFQSHHSISNQTQRIARLSERAAYKIGCAHTSLILVFTTIRGSSTFCETSRIQERDRKTKSRTDYSHRHHGWTHTKSGGLLHQTRHGAGVRSESADTWTHELDELRVGESVDGSH